MLAVLAPGAELLIFDSNNMPGLGWTPSLLLLIICLLIRLPPPPGRNFSSPPPAKS